ncbi:putative membrane transporter protein [Trypanosoma conorhini]|uniref:Putative membrane transporter protein n=1 Tax=Trypanosoma conorhini TaxID=83891 RepID=A0A3R7NHL1_9TRYP|nr:putative membrane transporter protein [Trypanosoma conorhini]RNF22226.1 putative membrane transporter protein [Trypanosoma conorhini]
MDAGPNWEREDNTVQTSTGAVDDRVTIHELFCQTLKVAVPTDVSSVLWMASQMITMAFVGHCLGEEGMSQYSAGILVFNVTAMSVVSGLNSAIDTISSQAFGQNPRSTVIGDTLQLAFVINFFLWIVMSVAFINSEPVMVYVFGDAVGKGAARFLGASPVYLLTQIITGIVSKTLYAQRLSPLVVYANGAAAITSPIANYFLIFMGIEGTALSLGLTGMMCAATHVLICLLHPKAVVREAQWPSPVLRQKEAWRRFFKVGIPSLIAVCSEWWAFEVQAFFAVSISPLALAVFGVAMNIISVMFSIALGLSVSASTLIGNALGAQRPLFASRYARFILICDVTLGVCTAVAMGYFGGHIARLYTNVPEMTSAVESIMPVVILCHLGDSLQYCLQGVFRGAGRPEQAARGVVFTLWLIGLPASALYVFVFHWGVEGVLGGLLTGFCFEIPLLYYLMSRWDWKVLAQEAQAVANVPEFVLLDNVSEIDDSGERDIELAEKTADEAEAVEL